MTPNRPSFYEIMVSIGHHLPEGRKCFDYSPEKLNNFFYHQTKKRPQTLVGLAFDWDGMFPTSDEISQGMLIMTSTRLLVSLSDRSHEYYFTDASEQAYEEFAGRRLTPQHRAAIEQIAREFDAELAKNQRIRFV